MLVKHLIKPITLTYAGKKSLGPNAYGLTFTSSNNFTWQAGQQALLDLSTPTKRHALKFLPIMSAPVEARFVVATKLNPNTSNDFNLALNKLKIGQNVILRGVFGRTIIKNYKKSYAFLATGISVSIFRSILKQLVASNQLDTKITLFFVGNKESHYFKDEFSNFKNSLTNFDIEYIYKPERITGQVIIDKLGNTIPNTVYFLAASPTIVKNYRRILLGLGVSTRHIKSTYHYFAKRYHHDQIKVA